MEDAAIVRLYWQRDEAAIRETREKYSAYLRKIAWQILANHEDCEESVNDTYFRAWNSMPPQKPGILSIYLGKLTRQLSIDLYRRKTRVKRGGSEYALSLTELEDCVSGGDTTGEELGFSLLHELTHFRRRDIWLKTLALWVNALHWFNPLMWYMVRLVERDTELACDEDALRRLSPQDYSGYGQTILAAVARLQKKPD